MNIKELYFEADTKNTKKIMLNIKTIRETKELMKLCDCGCKQEIPTVSRNAYRRYVNGHYWNGRHLSEATKEKKRKSAIDKNPIKSEYFKKLNKCNAYMLGYLFADGHFKKRKLIYDSGMKSRIHSSLNLSSIDKELIDKIKLEFGIEKRKTRISRKNSIHRKTLYTISISNHHFLQHLIKQGMIIGKKSDKIYIPKTIRKNKLFFFSFFRGFFDGDGSINSIFHAKHVRMGLATISYKFLVQMKNIMIDFGISSENIKIRNNNRCLRLRFNGRKNVYNLYKLMYKNADNLFLTRKKQRFEEFFKSYGWKVYNKNGILE